MKKNIIIYREWLLGQSETFIYEQSNRMTHFKPYYVGLKRVNGIKLEDDTVITLNNGTNLGEIKYYINKILSYNFNLNSHINNLEPVLMHAHFGPDAVNGLRLAQQLNIPFFVTFHGSDITRKRKYANSIWLKRYYKQQYKIFNKSKKIIAVSNYIKDKLIENGCPEEQIIVHYTGIEISNAPLKYNNRENEKIILFVGRLVENKGLRYLVDAMHIVQKFHRDSKLVIIGDGPLRESLEKYAKKMLVNYVFLGQLRHEEVKQMMSKASIFSVPSIEIETGESEGLGMVFLEASAHGVPIVSFKTGGIPEAVLDGQTGLLCESKNTEELIKNILYLLENRDIAMKFSINGKRFVDERFNILKQNKILEKIYFESI